MLYAIDNTSILQEGHDLFLRQNSIKESNINQHTSNCVSKIGVQISMFRQDNVHQNNLLKQLKRTMLNNNKICTLATTFFAKSNGVDENNSDDLLKCWSDYKGESLVSNEKSPSISAVR